ncbi:MAG: alpha/beta hydrolase family protein, partial [Clostridia bacterium]
DGQTLVFDLNGPDRPLEVYRLPLGHAGGAAAVTRSYRAGWAGGDFAAPDLVHIESFDGLSIPAWYYRAGDAAPAAAIVAVHGGPEGQSRPIFSALYQYWVSLGVSVLVPNVRGSTGYGKTYTHLDDVGRREDAIRDLAAVTEWLRLKPDIDADRVVVYGGSYGGYMVMAGLTWFPELYRAGVELVGIVNLESFLEKTSPWRRALREAEYGSLERDRAVLRELSPIHRIDRLKAPLFIGHGRNDPRVPYAEAEQVAQALAARGVPHVLFPMDDEGHGAVRLSNQRRLYAAVMEFLSSHAGFPGE